MCSVICRRRSAASISDSVEARADLAGWVVQQVGNVLGFNGETVAEAAAFAKVPSKGSIKGYSTP